jgi:hypothetical protein
MRVREIQAGDSRICISQGEASRMLGVSATRIRELWLAGEISTVVDSRRRLVIVRTVYDFIARRIAVTYLASGEIARAPVGQAAAAVRAERARAAKRPQARLCADRDITTGRRTQSPVQFEGSAIGEGPSSQGQGEG